MDRKNFFKTAGILSFGSTLGKPVTASGKNHTHTYAEISDREYWVDIMTKIAHPVLEALSEEKLRATMPVETHQDAEEDERKQFTHLEAFGRLMTGIAPWLELGADGTTKEGKLRAQYIDLARRSLAVAVDPDSPDFMNFNIEHQALVDAAFLAHALIKAPNELWHNSSKETRQNIVDALKSSRAIVPFYNNWILFSAMIEAALQKFTGDGDMMRMDLAVRTVEGWYLGDGVYGDGPDFSWDYYNSYVIQPFMLTILKVMQEAKPKYTSHHQKALTISQRYAEILQRMIAPDGSYPAVGRSIAYRYGAFQLLAQIAWMQQLPDDISPGGVRGGLTKVIRKVSEAPGMFDDNGWLRIGLYGHQPHLGEFYISTGSLYLCSAVFLPLGLPPESTFWTAESEATIEEKIWSGRDEEADHAI